MTAPERKVLVFGTFDGVHDGHRFFLDEAARLGQTLVIAIARDETVRKHKNKLPKNSEHARKEMIGREYPSANVVLGDAAAGSWKVLESIQPDVIALGYDQQELRAALGKHYADQNDKPLFVVIPDHFGDKLHTSLLHPSRE